MQIFDVLKEYANQNIRLFVDMDGVIADYEVGSAADYHKKRPLYTNLEKIEKASKMPNVEVFILSVTRKNEGIEQKNIWLDQFAPFFKKENRNILSREIYNLKKKAVDLKYEFLEALPRDDSKIIFIDDDPEILKKIHENFDDILLLKDTTLVD